MRSTSNFEVRTSKFALATAMSVLIAISLSARADQTGGRDVLFVCGQDQILAQPIPLTWANVVLAGDARMFMPCPRGEHTHEHREGRELTLIEAALGNLDQAKLVTFQPVVARQPTVGQPPPSPELRWRGAQALARTGQALGWFLEGNVITPACNPKIFIAGSRRWQPSQLFFLAMDAQADVRTEAAYGIGAQLANPTRELPEEFVEAATLEVRACVNREKVPKVSAVMLESLGVARYTPKQAQETGAFLLAESQIGPSFRILGAVKGLEALTRLNPKVEWGDLMKIRLRQLTLYGSRLDDTDTRIRRLALMASRNARDFDVTTLRQAVADTDFQVRRLVAMSLNLADPAQAALAEPLLNDPAFQVRYEILVPLQRQASRTGECAPMQKYLKDLSPTVAMRAMDLVPATCTDLKEILEIIDDYAEALKKSESNKYWHLPSRALAALVRLNPGRAKALLPAAVSHEAWQVRAAAATAAATLAEPAAAETLAMDVEPNVRTSALDALFRLKSRALPDAAINALNTQNDYQLLRAAALNLRGLPDDRKVEASEALVNALRRLTAEETDTSRDTREAIIDRLAETLPPQQSGDLVQYLSDYDDTVVEAAARAFGKLVGAPPGDRSRRRRYPDQPTEADLNSLPSQARIEFEEGSALIAFRSDVAPVTVARVVALIKQGYYNGKTFHRVVPNFVVQGGSPGKNEYAGVSRFMRDEAGPNAPHVRGAVGISTRGKDTGDAQIFIDLVDVPRLDYNYTVFASVIGGMDVIDKLLEGAVIRNISIIK